MLPGDQGGRPFEDHIRDLFMSNTANANAPRNGFAPEGQQPTPSASVPIPIVGFVPPHMRSAPQAAQQAYLQQAAQTAALRDAATANATAQSQQGGHKRLNQAQRRQMNAQLSLQPPSQTGPPQRGGAGPHSASGQSYLAPFHNGSSFQSPSTQRFPQNQQYSPRNLQHSPASPYSPQMQHPQNSPRSTGHQVHPSANYRSNNGPQNHSLRPNYSPQQLPFRQMNDKNQAEQLSGSFPPRGAQPQNRQLYQPGPYNNSSNNNYQQRRPFGYSAADVASQSAFLEALAFQYVRTVAINEEDAKEKEIFRAAIERLAQEAIGELEREVLANKDFDASTVQLKCFGSMATGFATKASDMDLALLTPQSRPTPEAPESRIPRAFEKMLLSKGYGARLLTRTRVPIIKLCEKPTAKLLTDMIAERKKWEDGGIAEEEEADVKQSSDPAPNKNPTKNLSVADSHAASDGQGDRPPLQQKEHQSLGDYYNCAKRLLRQKGGHDLTTGSLELADEDAKTLNEVCKGFVEGLFDQKLIARLSSYHTISFLFDSSQHSVQRSLSGIFSQMEGERLAIGWDRRPIKERSEARENEGLKCVSEWRELQMSNSAAAATHVYDKQLTTGVARLKGLQSLQLLFLEQFPNETPGQYCSRVQRTFDELKTPNGQYDSGVMSTIVPLYVAGVHNSVIRNELQAASTFATSLKDIAHQHQILQLVADYEHAIKVDLYADSDLAYVRQYISILQSHATGSPMVADAALVSKMRSLPDPTQVSLLKPRDRYHDPLEIPKSGVGQQCDINFSAHLGLHNTLLLRLYSVCDPRVKSMVLFVKHWAKVRSINTPYRGTLSSYGYVLMVLHYLVNIAQPFVCPNLQLIRKDPPPHLSAAEIEAQSVCQGRDVRFWRDEAEISSLAERKMINHNQDSLGLLLRGFFEYYAQGGQMTTVPGRGFDWGREVLSLRSHGGLITKQEKGWVGARTVVETKTMAAPPTPAELQPSPAAEGIDASGEAPKTPKPAVRTIEETKEIRHRYLFAIEDPFELDHNVARTVTHNGIVGIRDEFRRAWAIIKSGGKDALLEEVKGPGLEGKSALYRIMDAIHGAGA